MSYSSRRLLSARKREGLLILKCVIIRQEEIRPTAIAVLVGVKTRSTGVDLIIWILVEQKGGPSQAGDGE